ncbi:MAG: glycosyltransferase [Solirubrobacteraceae bacterium]
MPPEAALALSASSAQWNGRQPVPPDRTRPLIVADVTLFYGERSGGIRTYLEAKAEFARRTGRFEHHLVVPGRAGDGVGHEDANRHIQPSLRLAASNGYRIPLGAAGMLAALRAIGPDVVFLHDPYWTPRLASRAAHELGAAVIAVHHSSVALHAAGLPGPQEVYRRALRRWYRRAYQDVDAVMSVVDPGRDAHRAAELPLRLGLDSEFHPRPDVPRGDHVLYVGRLSREKGVRELLQATAESSEQWQLHLIGTGPARDALRDRAHEYGLDHRVQFYEYLSCREELGREYAAARCVVLPGPHETFGLVALEAAACGTPVVTACDTPAAALIPGFVETFPAGDAQALGAAIERARSRRPPCDAAEELGRCYGWDAALSAELDDLDRLLGR